MPSPTDFNLSPYYDDFDEAKKFHRILFRPAFAVQARELTQSQSILQNQVEKVSDHLFEKGAMVIPGEIGYDLNYFAVKLTSFSGTLSNYDGSVLTGGTSGVQAIVVNTAATDGSDPDTLFVKYIKTGTNNTATVFTDGETITGVGADSSAVSAVVDTTATGSAAEVQAGTYYINGFQVQVDNQTLILDKYTNTPSYRVGLTVTESFVTPSDDSTLNDNAAGSTNVNAPGAHRFKIQLTLAKLSLTSTSDSNFVELLRLSSGVIQNQVRTTEYSVLEDTLARRTFDESGDYIVRGFDIDIRESVLASNNRGIYSSGATTTDGGTAATTKLAVGIEPGKAYVKGYELENVGTKFIDVNKARDFDTESNFSTRFDIQNFVNVKNVFGSPDVGFVTGDTEAFKLLALHDTASSSRGTAQSTSGFTVPQIGRAKSRGFEYKSGSDTSDIMSSGSLTDSVYKHFLFDIEMFTHLNLTTNTSFSAGEKITGRTSGATAIVESVSVNGTDAVDSLTQATPTVITASSHGFVDGQQIAVSSGSFIKADSSTVSSGTFTVRNATSNTFELFDSDGTTSVGAGSNTESVVFSNTILVLTNVKGTFSAGEVIRNDDSSTFGTVQSDAIGFKAVRSFEFADVKQISMAGSPVYTADTDLSSSNGDNKVLSGTVSIANSATALTGFNTKFTTELKIGDQITFTDDAVTTVTKLVKNIISDTSLTLDSAVGGSDVTTKSVATRQRTKLQSPEKNTAIFKLPYKNIKTLLTTANSEVSDTSFKVRRQFTGTLSSDGDVTFTAGTNETFVSAAEADTIVSVMTAGGGSSTGVAGDVLSVTGSNHEGDTIYNLGGSPTGKTLTLDFGANMTGHKVKALLTVSRTVVGAKSKTLTSTTATVNTEALATASSGVNLGKADVFDILNVYMAADFSTAATTSDTDITARFDLDNGQRDNFYDIGRLKLKTGELQPTGRLLVSYRFFSHGSGDFFSVDSYSGVVDYSDIPSYTSDTTGQTFELRDCLDFRPRVDDASTIDAGGQNRSFDGSGASTVDIIKFNSDVSTDHEYYLNRIDKIFLDKEGDFVALEGASALEPQKPTDLDGAMHLYTLEIPSYTHNTDDVTITKKDNRRYTMRDIGLLEQRLENVEYYTQLNLLEQTAQVTQIQDADGFDRFKNGFIVDNFNGHGVGDINNNDYHAAIDYSRGELRAMHHTEGVNLIEADDDGTTIAAADRTAAGYQKTGDLITLPYSETAIITQPFATKSIPVNPFDIFTFVGSLSLTPPGDEWFETERLPEILTNETGQFDNLASNITNSNLQTNPFGSVWNQWQDFWQGTPSDSNTRDLGTRRQGRRIIRTERTTTTQEVAQTRTGVRTSLVTKAMREQLGDRVVSINILPFIRNRSIEFSATRMRPNTRVFPFFDNVDISTYVTPSGGSLGGNLVTDSNGAVSGTFSIPDPTVTTNPRWRSGRRIFRLTSSSTNSNDESAVNTSAEGVYTARGILDNEGSTREFFVVREALTENRRINRTTTRDTNRVIGWIDPLAQSFLIDDSGGAYMTSVDIFFATKDDNIPVTVRIQKMVNGYPGPEVLPFSEVTLNPGSVSTSTDGSTATKFTFESPVYLEENVEYCFVVISQCNTYSVYASRMGETVIGSDRTVSRQPYAGVLFKSQNGSTWTADQNEDLKFTMRRAEFTTSSNGTLTLCNDTYESRTLATNPLRTTSGSNVVRVFHPNHGMHGTSNNVTISGIGSSVNGIGASEFNTTHTSISNVGLDSYDITVSSNATSSGDGGGTAVVATQNKLYDLLNLQIMNVKHPDTTLGFNIKTTTGKSISGSETEFSLDSSTTSVVANDNILFTSPKMVASDINQTNEMSGSKSLFVNCVLGSTNSKLSPVIDLQRTSAFAVSNRLNTNPTTYPDYVSDTTNEGTTSAASYLTRPVVLDNTSTALDIRLTANVRTSSNILVYFRTSAADEARDINDISWTPFNSDGSEDTTIIPAEDDFTFREYKYSASNLNGFEAFQIKIVMTGTISSYPPKIRDMRGIALAV